MHNFWHGELDVLVCTSIVESGLDFPRANTLVVDQAQMFGLGQLYQLRGRVGRSDRQAYAFFVVPDAERLTPIAEERLRIIMQSAESVDPGNLAVRPSVPIAPAAPAGQAQGANAPVAAQAPATSAPATAASQAQGAAAVKPATPAAGQQAAAAGQASGLPFVLPAGAAPTTPAATATAASSAAPAAQADETPVGVHKLIITATEECWIHSSADKTDTRQFSLHKGDTFALTFSKSLELKLGNAGGVRLRYDGEDLPPAGQSGQVRNLAFPPSDRQ